MSSFDLLLRPREPVKQGNVQDALNDLADGTNPSEAKHKGSDRAEPARNSALRMLLFWCGDPVIDPWAVRCGSLKAYEVSREGEERVTGFYFAGDRIGWDALACGSFRSSAVALERTVVTPMPATAILGGALGSVQRQRQLLEVSTGSSCDCRRDYRSRIALPMSGWHVFYSGY